MRGFANLSTLWSSDPLSRYFPSTNVEFRLRILLRGWLRCYLASLELVMVWKLHADVLFGFGSLRSLATSYSFRSLIS